ncbi:MAG: ABC transporter ATP-binding protein [Woeseiaceae bacterium]|nr:ABC transporter ATP-binding protein [Woeseiaceae bacterium]
MTVHDNTLVHLRGLSRRFTEGEREHVVLDGVDLDIERGESVAICGRSGSGKSTLLNLVGGIDAPDAGEVIVDGISLTTLSEHERTLFRRRHIGFVYQAFNLIPTLSVSDNIRLVLELNNVKGRLATIRINTLLDAVGLDGRADSYPDVLSGGEQQRVAIARALSHEPPVLIADEPTGNLDDATAERIIELLSDIVREHGTTLVMATHSTRVAATCDRVINLHNGKIDAEHVVPGDVDSDS